MTDDSYRLNPLSVFAGAKPPAPDWFSANLSAKVEETSINVEGAAIELLCWGERGRPGILLVHGSSAHARWWSPIAPFLTSEFRVAAFSLSGMGGSDWRETYKVAGFAEEAFQAATAAGLFDAGPPVFIGHSFGGLPTLASAEQFGEKLAGIILADTFFDPNMLNIRPDFSGGPHKIYPSFAAALARFRLAPPQICTNLFYLDWIARHSLNEVRSNDGALGWSWRFDPAMWTNLVQIDSWNALAQTNCPMAILYGANSSILPFERVTLVKTQTALGTVFEAIADAQHHVMLDQPIEFIEKIARLCLNWLLPDRIVK